MNKKVLIVSYYLNLRDTDRCYTVYNYFKEKGYDVEALCGNYDHNSKKKVRYNLEGVREIEVIPYKKNMSLTRMISAVKFAFDVVKLLKTRTADVVYVVGPPNSTAYVLSKKLKNTYLVSDIYDLYPETIPFNKNVKKVANVLGFWWWSHMRNYAMKKCDCFIGSCKYYFELLGIKEDEKKKVVPLCKSNKKVERTEVVPNDKLNILYLGALTGNYDFEGLVKMLSIIKEKKDVELFIIGEGPRKEWLLNELKDKKIKYNFMGRIYDDAVKEEVMKKCHFGFNGFKENVAIALSYKSMEYMSNGLALINCCKSDTWNKVREKNIGINYNHGIINQVADEICKLSADEIFEMQKNAIIQYDENYSYDCYKKKMDRIFGQPVSGVDR